MRLRMPVAARSSGSVSTRVPSPGRIDEGDALRDQPAHAGRLRRGHQIARTLDAQARVALEPLVESRCAGCAGQIGELMDDDLRRGGEHGARKRRGVEHVDHHRLGAESAQRFGLVGGARGADDGVPGRAQQRRQSTPDRSARSGQKYFHADLPTRGSKLNGALQAAPAPRRSWPCGRPPPRAFPFLPRPPLPARARRNWRC